MRAPGWFRRKPGSAWTPCLRRLGLVSDQTLANTIADATGYLVVGGADFPQEPVAADLISPRFLRDVKAVPLAQPTPGFALR